MAYALVALVAFLAAATSETLAIIAIVVPSTALVISATITAYFGRRIHDEVKTSNGLTIAALADRAEGRRIAADVPEAEQTAHERAYVENLRNDA